MPIYKYKNSKGIQLYRVVYNTKTTKGNKQTAKRGFKTLKEAKLFEANEIAKNEKSSDMMLSDIIEIYLEDKKKRFKTNTYIGYVSKTKSIIKLFGDKKFKDYTYTQFHNVMSAYDKKDFTKLNAYIMTLKNINKFAYKVYDIKNRDIEKLEYFKINKVNDYEIWTNKQFNSFIDSLPSDRLDYKLYYQLLFYGGLRSGEALALQVKDIKNNSVDISKTRIAATNKINSPKTKSSIRSVTIPKKLMQDIIDYVDRQKMTDNDFIFMFTYSNATMLLKKYTNDLPNMRLHGLRHSHASILFENDMPISAISKRLGHSNITMTLNIYTHLTKKSSDILNNYILEI